MTTRRATRRRTGRRTGRRTHRTARDRYPTGCESLSHLNNACWGYLRTCPRCKRRICYADGAHDDADREHPGICDACASLIGNASDSP